MKGIICCPKRYRYNLMYFEFGYMTGPWPLKKNGAPKKKAGERFYDWYEKVFSAMPEEQQESYRVGGGCVEI